uniref:Serpin domain-containing protein n=1 Tax=Anopheles epiroticus TaxID=199890 RepID=A0A182PDB7_9DIPT
MRSHRGIPWMLALAALLLATLLSVNAANNPRASLQKPANQQQANRLHAPTANTKLVSDSVTNLAAKIANALSNQKSKTEIFSPVSIAGALSLLLLGSGGQTQQELLNVMGLNKGQLSFQEIHISFGRLFQDLVSNDPSLEPLVTWRLNDKCNRYDEEEEEDDDFPPPPSASNPNEYPSHQISVANGVFLQRGYTPARRFLNLTQRIYQGTVENLDFERAPDRAASYINEWCSRATRGKIREIVIEDILRNSRMIVANALYFKAQWETTFSPFGTRQRPFYPNGQLEPAFGVESMATSGCFPYYNASAEYGVQIIGLPYEAGKSTMYIILPNGSSRQTVREKLATLAAPQLNWLIDRMVVKKGMVVLPKLNISNRIRLTGILERLGVRELFDPVRSNLTTMFQDKQTVTSDQSNLLPTQTRLGTTDEAKVQPAVPTTTSPPAVRPPNVAQRPTTRQPAPKPTQANTTSAVASTLVTIELPAQECTMIENCQAGAGDKCTCNRIPTTDDSAAGCGAYLAGHYYDKANKHCHYGIEAGSLFTHVCIKPSYQMNMQYQNRAACEQRYECKMFLDICYCCTPRVVPNSLAQAPYQQTANSESLISNRFGGEEPTYSTTPLSTTPSPYGGEQQMVLCITVPQLVDAGSCSYYGYRWDTWRSVCVDIATCTQNRIKKRQAQNPPQVAARQLQVQSVQTPQQRLPPQPELQTQRRPQQQQQQQGPQYQINSLQQQQAQQRVPQQQQQQQRQQLQYQQQQLQYQQQQQTQQPQSRPQQPQTQQLLLQQRVQLQQKQQQQLQNQLLQQQQKQQNQPSRQLESIHVNEIITQVTLDVNEQGTEGGAVTAALIDRIGPGYSFVVDAPFLILIRNDVTQLPLFYGAVYDPRP